MIYIIYVPISFYKLLTYFLKFIILLTQVYKLTIEVSIHLVITLASQNILTKLLLKKFSLILFIINLLILFRWLFANDNFTETIFSIYITRYYIFLS